MFIALVSFFNKINVVSLQTYFYMFNMSALKLTCFLSLHGQTIIALWYVEGLPVMISLVHLTVVSFILLVLTVYLALVFSFHLIFFRIGMPKNTLLVSIY